MPERFQRKKRNRRQKQVEQERRIKRMSVFGLRIETRDDFEESNCEDFQNIRREIKDKSQSYRIGPAPVFDFHNKSTKYHTETAPGSLDSDIDESMIDEKLSPKYGEGLPSESEGSMTAQQGKKLSKAGCRGLLLYFAKLGRSEGDEKIDLEFVDSLLRGGADINFQDRHGQTCLHEIARDWHTDVAQYALSRGADIEKCDAYGRTPLHLATAVNYPEMVFWLLNNGAQINTRTKGENQSPIHYAAKYNAVDSLKVLLHMGANIGDRDYRDRTPLFAAAETGRSEACRFLLEQGAPVGVYDDGGTSALTLMVEKMPDVAKIALAQFEVVDKALRKKYFYLNYLECETWKKKSTLHGNPSKKSFAKTPLEVICAYNETELIMNPVILRLIAIKWQLFGQFYTAKNTCLNLMYTILWTILGVTLPKGDKKYFYTPTGRNSWRIVLEILALGMAIYFIVKQYLGFRRNNHRSKQYIEWKKNETQRDLEYCHIRWPEEKRYLTSEMSLIHRSTKPFFKNGWNIFELVTNIALGLVVITRILACSAEKSQFDGIHYKMFSVFLIMLWLRFMKSCQCYQSLGPFITMLGHVVTDTMKFGFLFFEFFIPYVCAFWILFGGKPETEFYYLNDVIYNVFLMTLVDEYKRDDIMKADKVMAQILVGTYLGIASVICINLFIALMSQTFTRVYQNAKATAFMHQASHLMEIEHMLTRKQKERVKRFMEDHCSPQVVYDSNMNDDDNSDQSKLTMYRMVQSLNEIKDKLLVLVMNSTIAKVDEEECASVNDVHTQVEIVRRKCDTLESQLDDLQSQLNRIEEESHTKPLADDNGKRMSIAGSPQYSDADMMQQVEDSNRLIQNVDLKLDTLIEIISDEFTIFQQEQDEFIKQNKRREYQLTRSCPSSPYHSLQDSDSADSLQDFERQKFRKRGPGCYIGDSNDSSELIRLSPQSFQDYNEFQKYKAFTKDRGHDICSKKKKSREANRTSKKVSRNNKFRKAYNNNLALKKSATFDNYSFYYRNRDNYPLTSKSLQNRHLSVALPRQHTLQRFYGNNMFNSYGNNSAMAPPYSEIPIPHAPSSESISVSSIKSSKNTKENNMPKITNSGEDSKRSLDTLLLKYGLNPNKFELRERASSQPPNKCIKEESLGHSVLQSGKSNLDQKVSVPEPYVDCQLSRSDRLQNNNNSNNNLLHVSLDESIKSNCSGNSERKAGEHCPLKYSKNPVKDKRKSLNTLLGQYGLDLSRFKLPRDSDTCNSNSKLSIANTEDEKDHYNERDSISLLNNENKSNTIEILDCNSNSDSDEYEERSSLLNKLQIQSYVSSSFEDRISSKNNRYVNDGNNDDNAKKDKKHDDDVQEPIGCSPRISSRRKNYGNTILNSRRRDKNDKGNDKKNNDENDNENSFTTDDESNVPSIGIFENAKFNNINDLNDTRL